MCRSGVDAQPSSIIIVTYNGMRYLERCLDAVARELRDGDEAIVVDNRSTDGSPEFVQERHPNIRLIENRENRGFAAACNQGAALAKGSVLVFLNQDTEVQPGWLDGLVGELAADEGVGLVTSHLLLMGDPGLTQTCGQDVHYTGLVFGRGYGRPAEWHDVACDVNAVVGASFAVRRELWERLHGFDEALYMYYEETDLSWRALMAGYRCRYAPASRVLHDENAGNPSDGRLFHSFRNRALVILRNWHPATLWLLAPALAVAELVELLLASARGRRGLRAKWRAHWWIATHGREVREMCARAQIERSLSDAAILRSLSAVVAPSEQDPGKMARWLVAAANAVFRLNRRGALWILRGPPPDAAQPTPGGPA